MNRSLAWRMSQLLPLVTWLSGCPVDERPLGDSSSAGTAGWLGEAGSGSSAAIGGHAGHADANSGAGVSEGGEAGDGEVASAGQAALGGASGLSSGGRGGVTGQSAGASGIGAHLGGASGAGGHLGGSGGGGGDPSGSTVCPEMNSASLANCRKSLASNPTFETNDAGWTAEANASTTWKSVDADSRPASGALNVQNEITESSAALSFAGAHQCLKVSGGIPYQLGVKLRIASGQDDSAAAGINVGFFGSVDCSGTALSSVTSNLPRETDSWLTAAATSTPPSAAHSMSVRLVVMKTFSAPAVAALFDDVLVTTP